MAEEVGRRTRAASARKPAARPCGGRGRPAPVGPGAAADRVLPRDQQLPQLFPASRTPPGNRAGHADPPRFRVAYPASAPALPPTETGLGGARRAPADSLREQVPGQGRRARVVEQPGVARQASAGWAPLELGLRSSTAVSESRPSSRQRPTGRYGPARPRGARAPPGGRRSGPARPSRPRPPSRLWQPGPAGSRSSVPPPPGFGQRARPGPSAHLPAGRPAAPVPRPRAKAEAVGGPVRCPPRRWAAVPGPAACPQQRGGRPASGSSGARSPPPGRSRPLHARASAAMPNRCPRSPRRSTNRGAQGRRPRAVARRGRVEGGRWRPRRVALASRAQGGREGREQHETPDSSRSRVEPRRGAGGGGRPLGPQQRWPAARAYSAGEARRRFEHAPPVCSNRPPHARAPRRPAGPAASASPARGSAAVAGLDGHLGTQPRWSSGDQPRWLPGRGRPPPANTQHQPHPRVHRREAAARPG